MKKLLQKTVSVMAVAMALFAFTANVSAQDAPTFVVDDIIQHEGTIDLGNIFKDKDGVGLSDDFVLSGTNLGEDATYTLRYTCKEAREYYPSIISGDEILFEYNAMFGDTVALELAADRFAEGLTFKFRFADDPESKGDYDGDTFEVLNEDGEVIYSATIKVSLKTEADRPAFIINDEVANGGFFNAGEMVLNEWGTARSAAFTVKGLNLEEGDYFLTISQPSAEFGLEMIDGNDEYNILYVPGMASMRPGFPPSPSDSTALESAIFTEGQSVQLSAMVNPSDPASGRFAATFKVYDESENVIFESTVAFTIGNVAKVNVVADKDTLEDYSVIDLGDIPFKGGDVMIKGHTFALVADTTTYEGNLEIHVKECSSRYGVFILDSKNKELASTIDRKALKKEDLAAGMPFKIQIKGSLPNYSAKDQVWPLTFKDEAGNAVYEVSLKFSLTQDPSFIINNNIVAEGTLELGNLTEKDGKLLSDTFTLKGTDLPEGAEYTFSIAQPENATVAIQTTKGDQVFTPGATPEAAALVAADLMADKGLAMILVVTPNGATGEMSGLVSVKDKDGKELYKATITFVVPAGSAVDNVEFAGNVWNEAGTLCIDIEEAVHADVYTIDGKHVLGAELTAGVNRINLAEGVYVLRVGNSVVKAVVR